jgi:hypothetical protein
LEGVQRTLSSPPRLNLRSTTKGVQQIEKRNKDNHVFPNGLR